MTFSEDARAVGEDDTSANNLRTSDLKGIIKERTEDLFGSVLGVKIKGHWTHFSTQQEQLLFLLATSRLLAEFATFSRCSSSQTYPQGLKSRGQRV